MVIFKNGLTDHILQSELHWWLVRATYVVDGLFFGHLFWKVVGTVRIHGNT